MLTTQEEYAAYVAHHFKLFNLNIDLCDPTNLKLQPNQLFKILAKLQNRLPSYLRKLPILDITFQFSVDNKISLNVFSPFSSNVMMVFQLEINAQRIELNCIYERAKEDVRKESLGTEVRTDIILIQDPNEFVILIVDDDMIIRQMLKRWLLKINPLFIIHERETGKEALEYIMSGGQCDLMFMDIQMPEMRGDVACKMIRDYENNIERVRILIVAMTASCIVKESFERFGFSFAIKKPLTFNKIGSLLKLFKRTVSFIQENDNQNDVILLTLYPDQEDLLVSQVMQVPAERDPFPVHRANFFHELVPNVSDRIVQKDADQEKDNPEETVSTCQCVIF